MNAGTYVSTYLGRTRWVPAGRQLCEACLGDGHGYRDAPHGEERAACPYCAGAGHVPVVRDTERCGPPDVCEACQTADCWCRRCGAPCAVGCECPDEREEEVA